MSERPTENAPRGDGPAPPLIQTRRFGDWLDPLAVKAVRVMEPTPRAAGGPDHPPRWAVDLHDGGVSLCRCETLADARAQADAFALAVIEGRQRHDRRLEALTVRRLETAAFTRDAAKVWKGGAA